MEGYEECEVRGDRIDELYHELIKETKRADKYLVNNM